MPLIHERINLEIQNHIAHVELARPEKMNALDHKTFEAIPMVGEMLRSDASVRVVVLSGQGDNFCSGLDKSNFEALLRQQAGSESDAVANANATLAKRTHGIANAVQYAAWMWRELPMPVIAAAKGMVLGGGLQIALGADIRYAAPDSQFAILEMKWGIIPDMSSTQIMKHMIRDDIIRELTYTARIFNAQDAQRWGFVTHIVDDPLESAMELAQQIAGQNPHAVRASKKVIENSYFQSQADGLLMESVEQDKIMGTPNQIEAVMAVMQKRMPNFKD